MSLTSINVIRFLFEYFIDLLINETLFLLFISKKIIRLSIINVSTFNFTLLIEIEKIIRTFNIVIRTSLKDLVDFVFKDLINLFLFYKSFRISIRLKIKRINRLLLKVNITLFLLNDFSNIYTLIK